jgi:hypothetical protein
MWTQFIWVRIGTNGCSEDSVSEKLILWNMCDADEARIIRQSTGIKRKLLKNNASIWINKICSHKGLVPTHKFMTPILNHSFSLLSWSRLMRSPSCLCVSPYQLLNGLTSLYETWYVYMATEPVSAACFINPSHQSVCLSLISLLRSGSAVIRSLLSLLGKRLGKHVTVEELFVACVCGFV